MSPDHSLMERTKDFLPRLIKVNHASTDLKDRLEQTVLLIAEALEVPFCGFFSLQTGGDHFILEAASNYSHRKAEPCRLDVKDENLRQAIQKKRPLIIAEWSNDFPKEYWQKIAGYKPSSFLGIPVSDENVTYGALVLLHDRPRAWAQEEVDLLDSASQEMAGALRNADVLLSAKERIVETLARENESMVREISTLYKISGHLMTTVSIDEIGKTVIRAITSEEGLGFDRAVICLMDEQEEVLKEVWRGEKGEESSARDIIIPLNKDGGALAQALQEKTPITINAGSDPVLSKIWFEGLDCADCAVVPIIAKDKVMGVIVVDNSCNNRATTKETVRVISMLANRTGLALDNVRLYTLLDRTNKELVEARGLLAEAEKLAAMGEMASTLAHEIRNPLVSIGGLARRAIKVVNGDNGGKRYLEVIVDEVGRLEKTLNELLDYAQEPEGSYAKKDLNHIVEECLELMRREFEEGSITVKKDLKSIPPIWCDERQIKHTLFNILLNARQAMPGGGTIRVSSSEEEEAAGGYVTCTIKDTGEGISEAIIHNIFNPFFTTKKGGSGLGLAISYRIVSHHGGKIEVENEPGQGVAFSVKLPMNSEPRGHNVYKPKNKVKKQKLE
ncbi:MAG: GAF domain-containing protein [Deltaproteobacteria bacterium]|nr:GAF domain-containing protein [Deltaproteobacteria bacterium]